METVIIDRIRMVDNNEKRLDKIKPLLDFLAGMQKVKIDNGLYIVNTGLLSDPNRSQEERLFYLLQADSARNGFTYNCFNYRNNETK